MTSGQFLFLSNWKRCKVHCFFAPITATQLREDQPTAAALDPESLCSENYKRVLEPGGGGGWIDAMRVVMAGAMMGELEEPFVVFQHTQKSLSATVGKVEYNRQPGRMYKSIQVGIIHPMDPSKQGTTLGRPWFRTCRAPCTQY